MGIQLGDVKEVAKLIGLSESQLNKLRVNNPEHSPPFIRLGRIVRYPITGENSLETWLAERTCGGLKGAAR